MKKWSLIAFCLMVLIMLEARGTHKIDISSVSNTLSAVAFLNQFSYANTNISSYAEADFRERDGAILLLVQKDFMVVETNALMSIADYLARGTFLPIGNYDVDIIAAHRADRFHEFGDSNYVVRAAYGYFGPQARACQQRYAYLRAYNSRLTEFRIGVFRSVASELARTRWNIYPENVRNALLQEFYRRANMTEEEERRVSR